MLTYKDIKRNKDTVCIVATGNAWDRCVFGNSNKDYWTLNNMFESSVDPNCFTEWFQLHRPGWGEGSVDTIEMRNFLQTWARPVWVQKDWGSELEVKNPVLYPFDEVVEKYGPRDIHGKPYPYFSNSIDYMVTLAILRGYREIQLYGVEFISLEDDEYFTMRQTLNYYLGRATELEIKVVVQEYSSLLKHPFIYAYERTRHDRLEDVMEENLAKVVGDQAEILQNIQQLQKSYDYMEGGRQTLEQVLKFAKLRDKGYPI